MALGWESLLRVTNSDSWGTPGTWSKSGRFLYADSSSLDYGGEVSERDAKMIGNRESADNTFGVDRYNPGGEFTFQPKPDDILPILMAHFQSCGVISAGGTYEFYRLNKNLDWTATAATNWAVNPYSINIAQTYGKTLVGAATGANAIFYQNGIVDKLSFTLKYGEDFSCNVGMKFRTATRLNLPATFGDYPNVYGSLSAFARLVDYHGTLEIAGETLDMDAWTGNFNNNSEGRARIGQRGYVRFPFSGKWVADGEFTMELQRELNQLAAGSFGVATVSIMSAAGIGIKIFQPNIAWKPWNPDVSDGQSVIDVTLPYRAYPPTGSSGPSTRVLVYTGSVYGTLLWGFGGTGGYV